MLRLQNSNHDSAPNNVPPGTAKIESLLKSYILMMTTMTALSEKVVRLCSALSGTELSWNNVLPRFKYRDTVLFPKVDVCRMLQLFPQESLLWPETFYIYIYIYNRRKKKNCLGGQSCWKLLTFLNRKRRWGGGGGCRLSFRLSCMPT